MAGFLMKEESKIVLEEFDLWLRTKFTEVFWFKGHEFKKTEGEDIIIDGGFFTKEEAKEVFKMLNSRNPFLRLNAKLTIWERNGFLIKIAIILAILALVLIYLRIRR
ncbi:hypothetical protein CW705_08655 [Candidatus Bathyarchaeota archaeon]|nr:MAG: hypothetical protein CW705_08655 [Candidatus Bathyarchaeota archaeon]